MAYNSIRRTTRESIFITGLPSSVEAEENLTWRIELSLTLFPIPIDHTLKSIISLRVGRFLHLTYNMFCFMNREKMKNVRNNEGIVRFLTDEIFEISMYRKNEILKMILETRISEVRKCHLWNIESINAISLLRKENTISSRSATKLADIWSYLQYVHEFLCTKSWFFVFEHTCMVYRIISILFIMECLGGMNHNQIMCYW